MLIKKKYSGEQQHLLSIIQIKLKQNNSILTFKSSSDHSAILNKLVSVGLIKSFTRSSFIHLVHLKSQLGSYKQVAVKEVQWFKKYGRHASLNTSAARKKVIKGGGVPMLLMNTDKGLLSHIEASKLHIGGTPLLYIN